MFDVFVEIGDRIRTNLKKPCLKKHLHITLEKHPIGLVECWRVFEEREEKSISLFTLFEQWPVRLQFWRKKYRMNCWRTKEIWIHRFTNECEWVPVRLQFCCCLSLRINWDIQKSNLGEKDEEDDHDWIRILESLSPAKYQLKKTTLNSIPNLYTQKCRESRYHAPWPWRRKNRANV